MCLIPTWEISGNLGIDRYSRMMQGEPKPLCRISSCDLARLPVPVRVALSHLWFESTHRYSDGNGRIGRAIVEHVFAGKAALPFSLSRQIEADKRGYYAALQAGRREGDRRHRFCAMVS